jgi:ABC-2 type transport system ATP-binding protein
MIDLLSERGCAVLFSSHILTDVERIADRVGILHGGRLVVDATLEDLKTRVQKRRWTGAGEKPPEVDGLLRTRAVRGGFDLTLLDADPVKEALLREGGAALSDPVVPTLEELFADLTAGTGEFGLIPEPEEVTP